MSSTRAWPRRAIFNEQDTSASRKRVTEVAVANKSKQALDQAEASFRKRASDATSAAAEIRDQRNVIQDKIARLRALRLAKEAADMQAAPAAKPSARKAR